MKIFKSLFFSFVSFFVAMPVLARLDDNGGGGTNNGDTPKTIGDMATILDNVMGYIFPVAAVVCVIFIIIGGYMWIASAGDPSKVKQAQGTLTWAIIGLIFVMVVRLIVGIVLNAL